MICSKCGTQNPEHAKYCMDCGQVLDLGNGKEKVLEAEGERKRITALFTDLTGYTAMAENLEPEELKDLKSRLYAEIKRVVSQYDGFIESFVGDGVLIVFGFPKAYEDTPVRAIQAAIDIHRFVDSMSSGYEDKLDRPLIMHSGIDTGLAVTGDKRSSKEYVAVTGDAVNVASRLSSLAQAGEIIVGPDTYTSAMHAFSFQALGPAQMKGKKMPVHMYKLLPDKAPVHGTSSERQISSELVGRERELATLVLQIQKVMQGHGSVVNVMGEAGIGKSRLIAELKKSDVMNEVLLLEGRAISIGKSLSFYPIIDLLRQWAGISTEETEAKTLQKLREAIWMVGPQESEEILPFVATLMGIKLSGKYAQRVAGIEGEAMEKLIIKNVRSLMIKISEKSPTVFVMEDLHWADATSIDLLDALYRLAEKHRLIFMNIFRPSYLEVWNKKVMNVGERLPVHHVQIELDPLDKINSMNLVNNILNIKDLPSSLSNIIMDRTDGNPLFIEEVVRYLIDQEFIIITTNGFQVTEGIEDAAIPATIHDVLMSRIDRLEEKTRQLVKVASVIGRCFFDRIIKDVADFIDDIDARLSYLKNIQLIRDRRHLGEVEYVFKHALVQEAAYASTLLSQRRYLHHKVAQSIELIFQKRLPDFYGMLAFHYSKAEVLDKAEEYMMKAGEEALKSSASSEALFYYRDVIKLYTEKYSESIDPNKMAELEGNLAFAFYYRGNQEEAIKYFNRSLSRLGMHDKNTNAAKSSQIIIKLLQIIILLYLPLPKGKKVPTYKENRIINIILAKGHLLALTDAKSMFANTMMGFKECFKFDLSKSQAALNAISGGAALFSFTGMSFSVGKKSLDYAQKYLSVNDGQVSPYYFKMFETIHNYLSGSWDCSLGEEYIDYDIKMGETFCASTHLLYIGYFYMERGEFHKTSEIVDRLRIISEEFNTDHASVMHYTLLSLLLKKQGKMQEAIDPIDGGLATAKKIGLSNRCFSFLGMLLQIRVNIGHFHQIHEILNEMGTHIEQEKRIVPYYYSSYIIGLLLYHIHCLEHAYYSKKNEHIAKYQDLASKSSRKAIKNSQKVFSDKPQTFCLVGRYYWIINRQKMALKWWNKSIQVGMNLKARPDLSRTYFEVGKRLLEAHSMYTTLNGIDGKGYLGKARDLFEQMSLQDDLSKLNKFVEKIA